MHLVNKFEGDCCRVAKILSERFQTPTYLLSEFKDKCRHCITALSWKRKRRVLKALEVCGLGISQVWFYDILLLEI